MKKRSQKRREKKISENGESDSDSIESSDMEEAAARKGDMEANTALMEMQKHELAKNIAKAVLTSAMTGKTRDNAFNASSWRAKQLVWPMSELTSRNPNMQLIMVIKMFDSLRMEPWFVHVATWMELESGATSKQIRCKDEGVVLSHEKRCVPGYEGQDCCAGST